jgi:hypothetical protein
VTHNSSRSSSGILVFPHPDHQPSGLSEHAVGVRVSTPVLLYLLKPPISVLLRPSAMDRTTVPKASVDEHRHAGRAEDDVRTTPHSWKWAAIDAVAKPEPMEHGANCPFCRSVALLG